MDSFIWADRLLFPHHHDTVSFLRSHCILLCHFCLKAPFHMSDTWGVPEHFSCSLTLAFKRCGGRKCSWKLWLKGQGEGKKEEKKRLMRIFIKQMCKIHHLLLKWWTGIVSRDKDYDKILLLNTIGLFLAVAHWKQCGCDKTRNISKFSLNLRQTGTRERYRQ